VIRLPRTARVPDLLTREPRAPDLRPVMSDISPAAETADRRRDDGSEVLRVEAGAQVSKCSSSSK